MGPSSSLPFLFSSCMQTPSPWIFRVVCKWKPIILCLRFAISSAIFQETWTEWGNLSTTLQTGGKCWGRKERERIQKGKTANKPSLSFDRPHFCSFLISILPLIFPDASSRTGICQYLSGDSEGKSFLLTVAPSPCPLWERETCFPRHDLGDVLCASRTIYHHVAYN